METKIFAFSSQVQKLKFNYLQRKKEIKNEFFLKNKALINCKNNSKNADTLLDELFKLVNLKDRSLRDKISICAVGGYGREILAPFSDLDILFLHNNELNQKKLKNFIQAFLYPLWDLGLQVGYAVRNIEESKYYSNKDHVIQTSMLETRFICGNKNIFFRVINEFKENIKKSGYKLIKDKIKERTKRVIETGYDYFKNEPNLKETAGSLRDVNLIFWILNIYKIINSSTTNTPSDLLTKKEKRILNNSLEFLLLLRCHLHYQSGRMNDVLSFDYQLTISKKIFFNFNSNNYLVDKNTFTEKMMKEYFIHIKNIKNFAEIFSQILDELFNKKLKKIKENIFTDDPNNFFSHYLHRIESGKDNASDKRILLEYIDKLDNSKILTKRNLFIFRKIFFSKNKEKFNLLYDLGILAKFVPEFSKISFLPQFDRFHSLTVGQHTLKAVNILKELDGKQIKKKKYNFFYDEFKKKFNKKALYYATLLHDIGKGMGGGHNEKGAKFAKEIVTKFLEKDKIIEETSWLVLNHSLLSDNAFKKDLEDHSVIVNLSDKIQTIPRLRALFFLTVTDISAVDQGLWSNWKSDLLRQLFLKLEDQIKRPKRIVSLNEKIEKIRKNILAKSKLITKSKLDKISKITYPNYWLLQSEKMILFQIENFFLKKEKSFNFIIRKTENDLFYELIIMTKDKPQFFLNLISIFVLEELSIFEARIFTLDDGTVIDTLKFSFDENKSFNEIDIQRVLSSTEKKLKQLGEGKNFEIVDYSKRKSPLLKSKFEVNIDNKSSATYTILNVVTNNRPKLLHDISKILIKNKIIISMAKISTSGDFVEDSFHLRSEYGLKINNTNVVTKIITDIKNKLQKSSGDVL